MSLPFFDDNMFGRTPTDIRHGKISGIGGLACLIGVIGIVIVVAADLAGYPQLLERFAGWFMAMFMFGFIIGALNSMIWETFF